MILSFRSQAFFAAALLSVLSLSGCSSSDEDQTGTSPKPAPSAPSPTPIPTLAVEPEPAPAPDPEPAKEPDPAPTPELPTREETAYVEEFGTPRDIPAEFKEYPEWGVFVYNDQLLRMYQERIDNSGGNADEVSKLNAQMSDASAAKDKAYDAMSERFSGN